MRVKSFTRAHAESITHTIFADPYKRGQAGASFIDLKQINSRLIALTYDPIEVVTAEQIDVFGRQRPKPVGRKPSAQRAPP